MPTLEIKPPNRFVKDTIYAIITLANTFRVMIALSPRILY